MDKQKKKKPPFAERHPKLNTLLGVLFLIILFALTMMLSQKAMMSMNKNAQQDPAQAASPQPPCESRHLQTQQHIHLYNKIHKKHVCAPHDHLF